MEDSFELRLISALMVLNKVIIFIKIHYSSN